MAASAGSEKKQGGFPAPITILLLVLILVWVATFFIPSGQYQLDASGSPIAGSFQNIAPPLDLEGRIRDLLLAPVNGLYGIQDPADRAGRAVQQRRHVRLGAGVPVHPGDRRLHDRGVRHRRARPRHPPPRLRASGRAARADRRPEPAVRRPGLGDGLERRDAGPLRADGAVDDRARLRPDGGGGRGRRSPPSSASDRVHHQPVRDRHRLGQGRDHHRRRHRAAPGAVRGADGGHDRLHALVREARQVRPVAVAGRDRRRGRGAGRRPTPRPRSR